MVTHPQQQSATSTVSNADSFLSVNSKDETSNQQQQQQSEEKPGQVKSIRRGRFSVVTHKPEELEEVVPLAEMGQPHPVINNIITSQASAFVNPALGHHHPSNEASYFPQPQQYQYQYPHQFVTPIGASGYISAYSPSQGMAPVQVNRKIFFKNYLITNLLITVNL